MLNALRDDILNGRLTPGSALGFAELTARYNASTGVLREALPRLVEQGLATAVPQLGYRVVDITVADLEHLTEARVAIETQVLGQSIRAADLDWEAEVVAAHYRLTQLGALRDDGGVSAEWMETHRRFHRVLLEGCPNVRLREVADRLRDVSEVYRCWSVRSTDELRKRDEEHAVITRLAVERDVEGAKHALADHINKTTEVLLHAQRRTTAEA